LNADAPAASMRRPSDVSGLWMPRPRKDSVVSDRIANAICRVTETMMTLIVFGMRCLTMMCQSEPPAERAASMNSFSLRDSTSARTARAIEVQPKMARMNAMWYQRTLVSIAPASAPVMTRNGITNMMSRNRIMIESTVPR
jgi:hypothetical protein